MRATIYLHSNKESNWTLGEKLGLTGEALRLFMYACTEVAVEIEVSQDGSATIVAVDGRSLEQKS
jgi:hypothetical protein